MEIIALVIFGFWGSHVSGGTLIILGIGAPILVAVIWGAFGSAKAPYALSGYSRLLLEIAVLGLATLALFFMGKQQLSYFYGFIALINLVLMRIWDQ